MKKLSMSTISLALEKETNDWIRSNAAAIKETGMALPGKMKRTIAVDGTPKADELRAQKRFPFDKFTLDGVNYVVFA